MYFQQALDSGSSSRPLKTELTGLLVPCQQTVHGYRCKFKLEYGFRECFLSMSDSIASLATRIEWEEVTVKGFLDPDDGLFEVEKINLAYPSEPLRRGLNPAELNSDLDQYKRTIYQRGKLDMAPDYLAL